MVLFSKIQLVTLNKDVLTVGSPPFKFAVPAIAAGSFYDISCEDKSVYPDLPNWCPVDLALIDNSDSVKVEAWANGLQSQGVVVINGTTKKISDYPIRFIRIVNVDTSATTANKIYVTLQKQGENPQNVAIKFGG